MRLLILVFATLALASCAVTRRIIHKDVKPVFDHPKFEKLRNELYSGATEEIKGRVWNGLEAQRGQFPYQALLFMLDPAAGWYLCGGSFVKYNYVLTAAHCLQGFTEVDVIGGNTDYMQVFPDEFFTKVTNPAHLIVHESYMPNLIRNDVGVIFLEHAPTDLFNNPWIGPISLPVAEDSAVSLVDENITISGFGMFNDEEGSNLLRYGWAPGITNAACQQVFGVAIVSAGNLCISTEHGFSTCSGDSGGPNTYRFRGEEETIVGITSFGAAAGCTLGYPAAFARVTHFLDWINSKIV